jgi:hypothetical protein
MVLLQKHEVDGVWGEQIFKRRQQSGVDSVKAVRFSI